MPKQRVFLILLGIVIAGVIVVLARRDREPEYGGKRLSEYLSGLSGNAAEKKRADEAIGQIGTNAIPYLLKWMQYETPAWKTQLYRALNPVLNRLNAEWELTNEKEVRADGA